MGPRESSPLRRPASARAPSDHPSAGPTAKITCWEPSSRRVPSQDASCSELICWPRPSRNIATASVLPRWRFNHSSSAFSLRKASVLQCAQPVHLFRYSRTRASQPSFPRLSEPVCARVTSIPRRISQQRAWGADAAGLIRLFKLQSSTVNSTEIHIHRPCILVQNRQPFYFQS